MQAFVQLRKALTGAPVLARPDFSRSFIVQCDASNATLGALIAQEFDDGKHLVLYLSRALMPPERNYSTTEKECLAMIWAIKKLRAYLEGYKFKVIIDHSPLKWLRNLKESTGRIVRWAMELQQSGFEVEHLKGSLYHFPDALSRIQVIDETEVATFELVNYGQLYRYRVDPLLDPVTNREFRERVVRDAHCESLPRHLGVEKTYDRITREYYWRGMYHDVHNFVNECETCQKLKI